MSVGAIGNTVCTTVPGTSADMPVGGVCTMSTGVPGGARPLPRGEGPQARYPGARPGGEGHQFLGETGPKGEGKYLYIAVYYVMLDIC
jgi:hypothetical protein